MRTNSEFSYLINIGEQMQITDQLEIAATLNFLDVNTKLIASGNYVQNGSSNTCNPASFLCSSSTASNYTVLNSIYPLLQATSVGLSTNAHSSIMFLYNSSEVVYLNTTQLGLSQASIDASIINTFMTSYPSSAATSTVYFLAEAAVSNSSVY